MTPAIATSWGFPAKGFFRTLLESPEKLRLRATDYEQSTDKCQSTAKGHLSYSGELTIYKF